MISRLASLVLIVTPVAWSPPRPAIAFAPSPQDSAPSKPAPPREALPVAADADFAELVAKTYDFHFSKLDEAGKKAKGAELDAFWKKVKDDPKRLLPALRHELDRTDRPSAFFQDGAYLLFTLSKEREDRERILAALTRVAIDDVQPRIFVGIVVELANLGFDTTVAAFKILENPEFSLFLPDHFLRVPQSRALLAMVLPTKPEYAVPAIVKRLATERDPVAIQSLLLVAWYTVTIDGDAVIDRAAHDQAQPQAIRDFAASLAKKSAAASSFDPNRLKDSLLDDEKIPADAASAREMRQKHLRGISDESMELVDDLTLLMRKLGEPRAK